VLDRYWERVDLVEMWLVLRGGCGWWSCRYGFGLGVVLGGLVKDGLCRVGDGRWAMGDGRWGGVVEGAIEMLEFAVAIAMEVVGMKVFHVLTALALVSAVPRYKRLGTSAYGIRDFVTNEAILSIADD